MSGFANIELPMDKLCLGSLEPEESPEIHTQEQKFVVLLSPGSFNPPTYMHLRMFELARDALHSEGFFVIGGYMSPVNDAYRKRDLISAKHRIEMCRLACKSSEFIMVDPWEVSFFLYKLILSVAYCLWNSDMELLSSFYKANQDTFQRTLTVLSRIKSSLVDNGRISGVIDSLKVMLVCGSDLLESFSIPGFWIPEQVRTICRDFGVVCIRREGQDIERLISNDEILNEYKSNIKVVDELVPNQISSTRVRDCISQGLSIKYLTADEVIEYIAKHHLYVTSTV